jgi:hypothetical protein
VRWSHTASGVTVTLVTLTTHAGGNNDEISPWSAWDIISSNIARRRPAPLLSANVTMTREMLASFVYSPMMHPEIPGGLAKLRRGDEAGVLELAKTYGSPCFSGLAAAARRCGGNPLPWIWAHAETLNI